MRNQALALVLAVVAGCGGAAPFGCFIAGRERVQAAMAADAAKKLASVFTATGQGVRFAHDARDAFGRTLAGELRKEGFAIRSTASGDELLVRYVVDVLKGTGLLRATVYVRRRTFSRAYAQRAGALYPVGPWSVGDSHGS